jgi:putative hydrolase of the HAD superfamily
MIQAITFDLWNTIFKNKFYSNLRLKFLTQYLENKQSSYSSSSLKVALKSAFNLPKRNYKENTHIYTEERVSKLFDILKIDIPKSDKDLIIKEFEEVILKDPPSLKFGVVQTLEKLSLNYKIGLISNTGITPGRVINRIFQDYKIFKFFQVKVYSDEIGYYKPHPLIFKKALSELKCSPQNTIHIGDMLETDIKGAKDCNMLTIWFNETNSPRSDYIQPDYEIYQISEVLQIIENLG